MANKTTLRNDLFTALLNTAGANQTEKTKLADRFVLAYKGEWDALVASGTTDNTQNRGRFLCQKTVDYWASVFKSEDLKEKRRKLAGEEL